MNGKARALFVVIWMLVLTACQPLPETAAGEAGSRPAAEAVHPPTPEDVVAVFCENFFVSAPPNFDSEAARMAYGMLSSSTQSNLNGIKAGLSGRLTVFAGFKEIPDLGFHISGVLEKTDELALVETCWHYVSDDEDSTEMVKVFVLARQEGLWKIDDIQRE
jgi:hypothetical protein